MLDRMRTDLPEDKELKVRIATRLHVQLHSIKILHGVRIQDAVTEALGMYFRERYPEGVPVLGLPRGETGAEGP